MTLSRTAKVLLVVYLAIAVFEPVAELNRWGLADGVALGLLMPVLAAFLVTARRRRDRLSNLVLVALIWSWLGDTIGGFGLLAKIGLFLVAQIAYVVAFWPYRRRSVLRSPLTLALYLVVLAAMIGLVARVSGDFWPAITAYGIAIGAMAITASGVNSHAAVGGVVFVVSDLALALSMFGAGALTGFLDAAVMPTYLLAQALLVWGVVRQQQVQAVPPDAPDAPAGAEALDLTPELDPDPASPSNPT